jgi:hypothetical protein
MRRLRTSGMAAIALGIVLLAVGWSISNDFLGFLFMVCVVVGIALVVTDVVVQRRGRAGT